MRWDSRGPNDTIYAENEESKKLRISFKILGFYIELAIMWIMAPFIENICELGQFGGRNNWNLILGVLIMGMSEQGFSDFSLKESLGELIDYMNYQLFCQEIMVQ